MSWQRVFENPVKTDEQVKLERAVKRAEKLLRDMAEGDQNWPALDRAISKAESLARFVTEEEREVVYTLRRRIAAAEEAGRAARERARAAEITRLREQERAGRPAPGSYKYELEIMRGRR